MPRYHMNQLKSGMKILMHGAPCAIAEVEFNKPGKGKGTTYIAYRNLLTGRMGEWVMQRSDEAESADVLELDMQYQGFDGECWRFLDRSGRLLIEADARATQDARQWLADNETCAVTLWNDEAVRVTPPNFVELAIADTEPAMRGDTRSAATKLAKLQTGARVRVPLFVSNSDRIRVDTRSGEYVGRAK